MSLAGAYVFDGALACLAAALLAFGWKTPRPRAPGGLPATG